MQKDIRATPQFQEAERLYRTLRQPGNEQINDAADINLSPDGRRAAFTGTFIDQLEGPASSRILEIDLQTAQVRVLTLGSHTDHLPQYSPDQQHIAFLSDRHRPGDFQLYLLELPTGTVRPGPFVEGWAESLQWSPDGKRILLGVAGHGADIAGVQGAVTSPSAAAETPPWMPEVQTGDEQNRWRSAWVFELETHRVRRISRADQNVWETSWCGNEALTAVTSTGPAEGHWYSATLHVIRLDTGESRQIYAPRDQLGWPSASPSGQQVAIVEAICSDRCFVAGDLRIIDTPSGQVRQIDTHGIDITYTEWRSERRLLLAGHRGFETVTALYDTSSQTLTEVWASEELSTASIYATVTGLRDTGDCALVAEGFGRPPEIGIIEQGQYRSVRSFGTSGSRAIPVPPAERITWKAPDSLEIQGYLLRPHGEGPHPLVMFIHGGPVWHWRPTWLGRRSAQILMLLNRGYAIFLPNPRGSSGRGQAFARRVVGDLGGADTRDFLSGLDHLVQQGIADPEKLGVTGLSYGGFMTSWLITQDPRFAAAVAVCPHTNQVTQHLLSNIPHFMSLFLADRYDNPSGKYFQRSPVMHARNARTPTLCVCGALDRCTPPQEAMQFHNALLENAVESTLIVYPQEGHGIRKFPAAIDYAARVVTWFETHMGTATPP